MKHFLALAALLAAGAYTGHALSENDEGAKPIDAGDIQARDDNLRASLTHAFAGDLTEGIADAKIAMKSMQEDIDGCFYEDESFTALKSLWSESCSDVIEAAQSEGMPYSLAMDTIIQAGDPETRSKSMELLTGIYGAEAAEKDREQNQFIENDLVPQLKSCDYETEVEGLSCAALIEAAKEESFNYFQMQGAIESATSGLTAESKSAVESQASPKSQSAKRQTSKP